MGIRHLPAVSRHKRGDAAVLLAARAIRAAGAWRGGHRAGTGGTLAASGWRFRRALRHPVDGSDDPFVPWFSWGRCRY